MDPLTDAAWQALEHALCSYSKFPVGAALHTADGRVFTGCNIENASYGLTVCAERVALWKALSEGVRAFTEIVVVTNAAKPTTPCGACRQLLWEFCGDIAVTSVTRDGTRLTRPMSALLPYGFDRDSLPLQKPG